MGYFSNETEGSMYQERYCTRCVHDTAHNCNVWLAHLAYNGKEGPSKVLDLLIPLDEKGFNKQCTMFHEVSDANTN